MSVKEELISMHEVAKKKAPKRGHILSDAIKKKIGTVTEEFRKDDWIRASKAWDACAREIVFRNSLPVPPPITSENNMAMELRMEIGSHLHHYLQNEILGPMGVLYGTWVPWQVRDKSDEYSKNPEFCRVGFYPNDTKKWFYVEETLRYEEAKIRGHHDGIICMNRVQAFIDGKSLAGMEGVEFKPALLEVKTTDDNVLRGLKDRGLDDVQDTYKCQATLYQKIKGFDSTIFFYIDRKYFAMVILEYHGEEKYWESTLEKAAYVKIGLESKVLPPKHEECPFKLSKKAKGCPYCDVCFTENIEEIFPSLVE